MTICNYYRGGTDRLTGFVFNTELKTYKRFQIKTDIWTETYYKDNVEFSRPLKEFKTPADIYYYFNTLTECFDKLNEIKELGFAEDETMKLDFGVVVL